MIGEDCECPRRILLVVWLGWEETHRVEGGSGVRRSLSNKDMLRDTTREDRRQSIGFIR